MAKTPAQSAAIGRGEGVSAPIEPSRIERIEHRQQQTDAKLGELVGAVSTLAESHRLAQEEQKAERIQYRADHKATHAAIQQLSTSTTKAMADIRDRIGQSREFKWGPTIGVVSLVWAVSLAVVGWGSRQEAMNLVNQTKLEVREAYMRDVVVPRFENNEADIERIRQAAEDRFTGTQGNALEQRVTRLEALGEASE
jgi:hypothetical protein